MIPRSLSRSLESRALSIIFSFVLKVCELINLSEAYYDSQLAKIAEEIYLKGNKISFVLH